MRGSFAGARPCSPGPAVACFLTKSDASGTQTGVHGALQSIPEMRYAVGRDG